MEVLHLTWEYPPDISGGLGRHVEGLTAALVRRGATVWVVTPCGDDDGGGSAGGGSAGVQVQRVSGPAVPLPPEQWVAAVLDANVRMARAVLSTARRPHVLHAHDWMVGPAASLLRTALTIPLVATIHATERGRHHGAIPPGVSGWIDAMERELVSAADRVAVCASAMREVICRQLGADAERVVVTPNGVDETRWRVRGVRRQPRRVVLAGRLEHEKGVHILLQAADGLDCHVVVAGDGTQAATLRAAASAQVHFTGRLEQRALARLLATATLVVVPSLYEPFGLVALEAMAAGAPVVASRTGGLTAVVDGAGALVPPGDVEALRRTLRRLLADPQARARMAAAGRLRARGRTWDRAADAALALYRAVSPR